MAKSLNELLAAAKAGMNRNQNRTVKPPKGKSTWRILPSLDDTNPLAFYREMGQHWVKDAKGQLVAVVICDEITFGKHCAVCEALDKAKRAAPDEETKKLLDESYAKRSYIMNAVCIEGEKVGDEVHILEVGKKVMEQIIDAISETNEILEPGVGGCDIVITRDGAGLNTTYSVTVRQASRCKPVSKSAMMQRHDLEAFVTEEAEAKKRKALETFGAILDEAGVLAPASQPQRLANLAQEIDDEIPFRASEPKPSVTPDVTEAEVVTAKAFDEKPLDDLSDEDIDAMLARI